MNFPSAALPLRAEQLAKFLPTIHDLERRRFPMQLHEDQLPHNPHSGVSAETARDYRKHQKNHAPFGFRKQKNA